MSIRSASSRWLAPSPSAAARRSTQFQRLAPLAHPRVEQVVLGPVREVQAASEGGSIGA